MRLPAVTLLALCACNQIYGLDKTKVVDAPPDAADRQVRLSMLVGGATDTASEAAPMLVDVTPDPKARIALVDEALKPVGYGMGGVVGYPNNFLAKPWRLEYTPPDGTPVEVQWSPAEGAGHVVVPVIGRVARTQVPTGTGYAVRLKKPDQTFHTFADPVVYTTGYWSATPGTVSSMLNIDFSVAPSMSGPAGAPSAAAKDVVVAIDYSVDAGTGCRYASRAGSGLASELENGMMKPLDLPLDTSSEAVVLTYVVEAPMDAQGHLLTVLGPRGDDQSGSRVIYGRFAHSGLPAFTTTISGVPAPAMIPLATCPVLVQTPPSMNDAGSGLAFTKGMFSYVTNDRTVSGVRLRSSIATVGFLSSGTSTYEATFDVPLATTVQLGAKDLIAADGGLIASTPSDLTIGIEPNRPFDYVEVALYKLTANSLELVRTYVATTSTATATLRFDPSVMMPNAEHVFAIRTYRGRPGARQSDFSTVQAPQAVGTIFTRTFRR